MAEPTYQNLLDENRRLREENRQLRQENQRLREESRQLRIRLDALEAQVLKLTALLEQAQRAGKREAAPFSKGPPKDNPKTPGRKSGENYGPKAHRPLPEQEPDQIIDVPLPDQCPHCGGDPCRSDSRAPDLFRGHRDPMAVAWQSGHALLPVRMLEIPFSRGYTRSVRITGRLKHTQ